ncbi:hypothetical protein GJ744_010316 [Endocarpon pusillum]|uniref:Uncharacterized protein n=1 Tax=Endocarpon pusillum TaxID=364733 RepID=A0A8H7AEA3_9EURO|nr:hypothetical protein GJ744_010316 [Endocarpon pusillum]
MNEDVAATSAIDNAIHPFAQDEKNEDPMQIVPDIEHLVVDPHPNPKPIPNNDEHKNEEDVDASDDEDGPTLTLPLAQDVLRKDHLSVFRSKTPEPVPTKTYRPSEQQLLQEGKLGDSHFSARLKKVKFGRYTTETGERVPACLILVRVDFIPKNRGWFRFRDANVEVAFTDGSGAVSNRISANDDDVDDDDETVYTGPLVLKFYPDLIRGHTQSVSEQFNLLLNVPLAPLPAGGTMIKAKEGLHLVHGRLMGEPETRVKWKMHENEVVKGGVYEQPTLAVLVRYREGEPFTMALNIKATTYGGLAVTGKRGASITFKPGKHGARKEEPSMVGLTGGSVQMGGQTWGVKKGASTEPSDEDLEALDLEALTGMRAALLGAQGPGSAAPSV